MTMRKGWLAAGAAALALLVLGYAWIDGGREPLRTISVSVPVPESAR
jgi:hypothetical protein